MTNTRRFTNDEKASLAHALMHVEANEIAAPAAHGGWYRGNKDQFIKRHIKAMALLRILLNGTAVLLILLTCGCRVLRNEANRSVVGRNGLRSLRHVAVWGGEAQADVSRV